VPQAASSGSGFVVSAKGHVVTNNHVVAGCKEMRTADQHVATVVATDEARDLAIVKLQQGGEAATFRNGGDARPGDDIVVLGYPLYGLLGSDAIVTTGTISSLAGPRDNRNLIQISAPVNPGNSGGPVLDGAGHVVGVVVSKLDALGFAKATGDIPENINFAISEGTVRSFLDAHGVPYRAAASAEKLSAADVASRSRGFTILLECFK
jgi:S1-C subfamily serine protease